MTSSAVPKQSQLEISREEAFALLSEWTKTESLIKHALAVEAACRWYAKRFGEDEHCWGITGLLHDFDYEKHPTASPDGHPFVGCAVLEKQGYPELLINAILGHAEYSGTSRESQLAKVLFACDELAGLITAATMVRPDRSLHTLNVKSVQKKLKDKAFARGVNREDVRKGAEELGIELGEHIGNVIEAMREVATELGLAGENVTAANAPEKTTNE